MPTVLQHRRGTTAQNNSFTGAVGETTIDTTLNVVVVQDGTTQGGFPQVNTTSTQTVYNKTFPVISGVTVHSGNLVANSATASTSTTAGALVVVGGIGVSGNIFLSGNVVGNGNGAWTIPVGTSVQRPGIASQGMIRYNSTISSFEGFGAGSAWSSLGGVKSVDGFATITAEASAGAGDDVLRFYSGSTGSSVQVMWASAGNISILTSTTSTSTTTGALQVTGGISTQGNLYVGGNLVVTGTQTFLNTETVTATEYATTINATNLYASTIGNTGATLTGTLSTASQTNITSVGTLTGLTVSGAIVPNANVAVNIGSSSSWFNNIYGTAIHAAYADLAENYTTDAKYAPGTVVVFGGDKEITVTTTSHDTRVAGVISTDPAYLMNGATVGLPVAMTGRVPCQVQGPISKGQVLVTSVTAGVAEAIDNTKFLPGCVVGKALGAINTNSIETIEVVVGRF
jgi:hypothetical protein